MHPAKRDDFLSMHQTHSRSDLQLSYVYLSQDRTTSLDSFSESLSQCDKVDPDVAGEVIQVDL